MYKGIKGLDMNGNMMRVGNAYIFINPMIGDDNESDTIMNISAALSRGSRRVHFIYSNPAAVLGLPDLINLMRNDPDGVLNRCSGGCYNIDAMKKLIIHIPKVYEDLETVFMEQTDCLNVLPWTFSKEPESISFAVPNGYYDDEECMYSNISLILHFQERLIYTDVKIKRDYRGDSIKPGYFIRGLGERGAIQNHCHRLCPEMFKKKIIDNFKECTPEAILGNFKDDDDIWDYINKQGDWTPPAKH